MQHPHPRVTLVAKQRQPARRSPSPAKERARGIPSGAPIKHEPAAAPWQLLHLHAKLFSNWVNYRARHSAEMLREFGEVARLLPRQQGQIEARAECERFCCLAQLSHMTYGS